MIRQFTLRQIKRALGIAALVLCVGGFSAHATLIVLKAAQARTAAAEIVPAGFDVQDHFPGSALLYPADEQAAPAVGATGTTALPDLPIPEGADTLSTDGTIRAAQPFSMAGASPIAKARALQCLSTAIYYEAASESEAGQRAVAQVILNRVRHPAFPNSVCGVIYQGSDRSGCQFSYACDGSMARVPSREGMARAVRYAAQALNGYVMPQVGEATHYHTYAVAPSWNRTLVMTATIGAHFFHRWKGYWGTPNAFSQRYAGVEPMPGPKPHAATAQVAAATLVPAMPAGRTPAPFAKAAYADSGLPKTAAPVAAQAGLPESTMLDKWAGTGQPLQ